MPKRKAPRGSIEIKPYPQNAKKHPKKQVEQIAASIKEFGMNQPIVVDKKGVIIVGHGRYEAMKLLGMELKPEHIITVDLTDEQAKAYRLADNKLNESEWDMNLVIEELKGLSEPMLELTGFDKDLIIEPDEKDDEVPDVPEEPQSKLGDLYELGEHRVLCGDSTKLEDVERLMDGKKADMVFTDPPYGIAYSSSKYDGNRAGVTNKRNKAEMIKGDADDFDPSFLVSMFKSAKEFFVWGYQYYPDKLGRGGIIVWNKKQENEANNPHGDFELCWSRKERNKMCWLRWGGFNNKEKGEDRLHTTQKPVDLATWFFRNWGDGLITVVDLFLGSGSTLIAAEKTGRICYGMELDPKYVDVIVQRYVDYTGNATIVKNGETVIWQARKQGSQ